MTAVWEMIGDGIATGPSIIVVGETEVAAYWSDADGVRLDIRGRVDDLDPNTVRAIGDALRQLADLRGPA